MNVLEAIRTRRAHRAFTGAPVEEQVLRGLLDAAVQAPSAMNAQPWRFAVVQNATQLKDLSTRAKRLLLDRAGPSAKLAHYRELLSDDAFDIFYGAGTLVAIGVEAPNDFSAADCWLAAQNLMLAATELGLGTCCIGFAVPVLNTGDAKRELGFGPGAAVYAPIIVGQPTAQPRPVARRPPLIVGWSRPAASAR